LQSKIDEQTLLLREEKARAGFWGMIFDKKAKARIKEIEQNLNSMHDQMEKLVGDRDIREVLGEEEIDIAQRRQEPKENNMTLINQASEFGGLYDALKEIGEVERSTGKVDSAEELIKNIEEIRKFYAEQNISTPMPENHIILNQFTRNFGLREKVRELLNKEIVDRATEKKEQMA
jgi:hypothetical protein